MIFKYYIFIIYKIFINVVIFCKWYPINLLYIIIKIYGKWWDFFKFMDVFLINNNIYIIY